jgi:hypothetical protein
VRKGPSVVIVLGGIAFGACGPKDVLRPPPPPPPPIVAAPASGDLSWSVDEVSHPMRTGAASIGPGGRIELLFADAKVEKACDAVATMRDPKTGPERVRVDVPRGLDVDYPLKRTVSSEPLRLLPVDPKAQSATARNVARYGVEIETIEWKPGGRVVGHVAWVSPSPQSFGEGRFDLPLCATQAQIAALDNVSKPHAIDPKGPVKGKTVSSAFVAARAFAEVRTLPGLPPHIVRIELSSDPLATCASRGGPHTTSVVVDVDLETGLGKRNGSRQPIRDARCEGNHVTWPCFGESVNVRGFIELRETDLRVGGFLKGALAIEGIDESAVSGVFDVELCKPE